MNSIAPNRETLALRDGTALACQRLPGRAPGIVFLSGFRSDMTGTKATYLRDWAAARGRAVVAFDYSGHGASSGVFAERGIGDWAAEAVAVLDRLTEGPQIVVGSSMGGWLMCLLALARPERLAALVGLAAAPDFTDELLLRELSAEQRAALARDGRVRVESGYGESYELRREFFAEARTHFVLKRKLPLGVPLRLLHGTADSEVPWRQALRLLEHAQSPDATLTLVKDGEHRLSRPQDLALLGATLDALSGSGA